tara:strand:- start:157 stop:948 length:792 start_codon:yes stop_codon:yes gene_type:complete
MLFTSNVFSAYLLGTERPIFLEDGCPEEIPFDCTGGFLSCKNQLMYIAEGLQGIKSWEKTAEPEEISCAKILLKSIYDSEDADTQYAIAEGYSFSSGWPPYDERKNEFKTKAVDWFKRAGSEGHAESQIELGEIYKHQDGGTFEAISWFKKAALQGNQKGQSNLAEMYTEIREYQLAVSWHKKAAEQGLSGSWLRLAEIYESGIGVPENFIKAYAWRSMYKSKWPNHGEKEMERLKNKMTKEQISKGQELASKCWNSKFKDCD